MRRDIRRLTPLPDRTPALISPALRALERQALMALPTHCPSLLMERAGLAAARLLRAVAPETQRVSVLCGPGNNGGDGLVCARHLKQMGLEVRVHSVGGDSRTADHAAARTLAQQAGVHFAPAQETPADSQWWVDALLGIGASGAPRGEWAAALAGWQVHPARRLALDAPSGLDADTGADWGAVRCDHTLTYLAAKPGLFTGAGRDLCGEIWLADLGVPAPPHGDAVLVGAEALQEWLAHAPRARHPHLAHKGRQGDVWVWAGTMPGAAQLAALAALLAGSGRVYLAGSPDLPPPPSPRPELIQRQLHASDLPEGSTAVVGCGWGGGRQSDLATLMRCAQRLVLDADGLNAVALDSDLQEQLRQRTQHGAPTVLTPHPLEAARLLATDSARVQANRLEAAQALAERFECAVLLKGSGTVCAHPGLAPKIITTGHGALASAGTGDVLAGWLGGLWAQAPALHPQQLASLGAAWHGLSVAAVPLGGGPLSASEVLSSMARLHPASPAPDGLFGPPVT